MYIDQSNIQAMLKPYDKYKCMLGISASIFLLSGIAFSVIESIVCPSDNDYSENPMNPHNATDGAISEKSDCDYISSKYYIVNAVIFSLSVSFLVYTIKKLLSTYDAIKQYKDTVAGSFQHLNVGQFVRILREYNDETPLTKADEEEVEMSSGMNETSDMQYTAM